MDTPTQTEVSIIQQRLNAALCALEISEERATAGRLALEVMHEIKNPLEALGHLIFLTIREADDNEKVRANMSLAEEQMKTLGEIATQTLGFGRQSTVPKSVDLLALTEAAVRIHQRKIETKKIHLVKDLPQGIVAPVIMGEMLQVISNLIVNALDSLAPDGVLSLRLRRHGDKIHIVVADNGCGIPQEHREAVFQPFFTTKEERGNGLGLALSKNIVERHRGAISMRSSVRPGKSGTIFRICLPTAPAENADKVAIVRN